MRHTHYIVQAFDEETSLGDLIGLATVEVIAEDEGQAISKAQTFAGGRAWYRFCLLYTSPSPRDRQKSRMPSSA